MERLAPMSAFAQLAGLQSQCQYVAKGHVIADERPVA
jgi:hypothetical protein